MYILAVQVSLYICINSDKWQYYSRTYYHEYIYREYYCMVSKIFCVILKLNSRLYVREKIDQNDAINNVSQAH